MGLEYAGYLLLIDVLRFLAALYAFFSVLPVNIDKRQLPGGPVVPEILTGDQMSWHLAKWLLFTCTNPCPGKTAREFPHAIVYDLRTHGTDKNKTNKKERNISNDGKTVVRMQLAEILVLMMT